MPATVKTNAKNAVMIGIKPRDSNIPMIKAMTSFTDMKYPFKKAPPTGRATLTGNEKTKLCHAISDAEPPDPTQSLRPQQQQ
jgi:hypothetical protein